MGTKHQRGWRVAVTGAAGFIGSAVVQRLRQGMIGPIAELRLNDIQPCESHGAAIVTGSYADAAVRTRLIGDGVDFLFHLASLPGGASERDPVLGKSINLDASIALIDRAACSHCPVIVYTSSIAAIGRSSAPVTPATALRPASSYAAHKAMVEYYLADLTRRGVADARSVRPAGIVARPKTAFAGFATAWMSDVFHAAQEHRAIPIPARRDAHIWLQSISTVADNIIHAALLPGADLPPSRVWTLPASVVQVGALIDALGAATGAAMQVTYGDGPTDHPPLDASDALSIGFKTDGDTPALVAAVLSQMANQ